MRYDTANGPGIRTTLFVSGCNHKCEGCHNPETWDENSGKLFSGATINEIIASLAYHYINGLSISGGDPLHPSNRSQVSMLAHIIKYTYPSKSIWLWTGYLYEDIKDLPIMEYVDVLVDGPFILSKRDITLPYSGSTNQRVIDVKKTRELGDIVLYKHE